MSGLKKGSSLLVLDKIQRSSKKNSGTVLNTKLITSLFYKYRFNEKLLKGGWFLKMLRKRLFKRTGFNKGLPILYNILQRRQKIKSLYNSLIKRSKKQKESHKVVVYVALRRSNIFVTIVKNGNVLRTLSSGIFKKLVLKRDRKRSPSFFTVIKKTLYYLRSHIRMRPEEVSFRVVMTGRKIFAEPLLRRFFYNKGFREKCAGYHLLNGLPFNGCRKRKPKRLKRRRLRRRF